MNHNSGQEFNELNFWLLSHSLPGVPHRTQRFCTHLNFLCLSEENNIHLDVQLTYLSCYTTFSSLMWMCDLWKFKVEVSAVPHYWCSHVNQGWLQFIHLLSQLVTSDLVDIWVEHELISALYYIFDVYFLLLFFFFTTHCLVFCVSSVL